MFLLYRSCRASSGGQRAELARIVDNSDGNGGVPVPAERRPRVRPPVLHAAQQGARLSAQVYHLLSLTCLKNRDNVDLLLLSNNYMQEIYNTIT